MALLHFQNMVEHRPDVLMKNVYYGLKSYYVYLERMKKNFESDDAVLRLAVRTGFIPEKCWRNTGEKNQLGDEVWVELSEPDNVTLASDKTIEAFMADDVKFVYETGSAALAKQSSHNVKEKKFSKEREIKVLGKDIETEQLLLERKPKGDILLRPNTYTISKQLKAIRWLQDAPSTAHLPLLRLFETTTHANWPGMPLEYNQICFKKDIDSVTGQEIEVPDENGIETMVDWTVLTDSNRQGTTEQRLFVATALNTPDFALLEGPPGSGKTTAICELIIQLIHQGKRVLLCASTHVAVDNVIERLMDDKNLHRDVVIPIRIGRADSISDRVLPWILDRFVKTESKRIKKHLKCQSAPTDSQSLFQNLIQNDSSLIERFVLECANLVCGTAIGLLQHPDIKNRKNIGSPEFDVMIIDEASKTTFQEFLVPALHAKRWILVGDPKQLSPFVDDQELAVNITPCLPKPVIRNACVDTFMAKQGFIKKRRVCVVEISTDEAAKIYQKQALKRGVCLQRAEPENSLAYADIVIGNYQDLRRSEEFLPLDATTFRSNGNKSIVPKAQRRAVAYMNSLNLKPSDNPCWENEIAWRLVRLYEQRYVSENTEEESKNKTIAKLESGIYDLMPASGLEGVNATKIKEDIDSVKRVALPSILECLNLGYGCNTHNKSSTALTDGLPDKVVAERRVLLRYQHRMHPDIAEFSHQHIYAKKALISADDMENKRNWHYRKYSTRVAWIDVKGKPGMKTSNEAEAKEILKSLKDFDHWASGNSNERKPWEVAILCFYRGQEYELQQHLKQWTGSQSKRYFNRGEKNKPYLTLQLCTVDRFQGHEADLVFLSFSNDHVTSFLESPNRLNVALTRARYQLVILGNRHALKKSKSLVGKLASHTQWGTSLEN